MEKITVNTTYQKPIRLMVPVKGKSEIKDESSQDYTVYKFLVENWF